MKIAKVIVIEIFLLNLYNDKQNWYRNRYC